MRCILCGALSFQVIADRLRYGEVRRVVRCESCSLVSLENPADSPVNYAAKDYRERYGPVLGRKTTPEEMYALSLPLQGPRLARVLSLLTPASRVLEAGSSTGHFLQTLRSSVSKVVGVEPDPDQARFASASLRLDVHNSTLESAPLEAGGFDVVVSFQVLEHVADPLGFLGACHRALAPGGRLHVEVPNLDDTLLSIFGNRPYRDFYFKTPHLYYYSRATLVRLMERAGFSGSVSTAQSYSLFNHVHWLLIGKPQPSQADGSGVPPWIPSDPSWTPFSDQLRQWLADVDRQYRELLSNRGTGEILVFSGVRRESN